MSAVTIAQALQTALAFHQRGSLAEAETIYRQVLAVSPSEPDALHLLGCILAARGDDQAAETLTRQAIALRPDTAVFHDSLAHLLRCLARPAEAVESGRIAVHLDPQLVSAHNNLGGAFCEIGAVEEGIAAFREAVRLRPDVVPTQLNLAQALCQAGHPGEAILALEEAARLSPANAILPMRSGVILASLGRLPAALTKLRAALALAPGDAGILNELGRTLALAGEFPEAETVLRAAIHAQPDFLAAHLNLGAVLQSTQRVEPATEYFQTAIRIDPSCAAAYGNLGNALEQTAQIGAAVSVYRQAVELEPTDASLHSDLANALLFDPAADAGTIQRELERWNARHAEPLRQTWEAHDNYRDPNRRLRIGYVSPDFRDHVVGRNVLPLLRLHDHRSFEIFCYSGTPRPDDLTAQFRRHADGWREIAGESDASLADRVRADRIDILVDLSLHTAGNRLLVFARKPAPVQVSFAGYPGTTGLAAIDANLTDSQLEPAPATQGSIRLPSFWCYDPSGIELPTNPLPALDRGWVTFGCLNNFCKINDTVLKLWARVLAAVPRSRLLVIAAPGAHRQRTVEALGVAAERVEFAGKCPRSEYLALYHRVDVALDPFPYNGHTTSLDALWMGVSVVSLIGRSPVSRAGVSQLTNIGLPELLADTEDDYVRIAVELASDLPRLSTLRAGLRSRMEASPLMDAAGFSRNVESAFRILWQRWCADREAAA